jgi:hypothetical protein
MFSCHTLLRTAIAASAVTAILAGCGQMQSSQKADTQKTDTYQATLAGAQEVPPVNTSGTGSAEVQFNKDTNVLSWKVTYSGLSGTATAAHIHGPAAAGQNAGVLVPFTAVTSQPITGQAPITPQQASDLAAGRWYVNVHTAANPGGEIRGQLQRR